MSKVTVRFPFKEEHLSISCEIDPPGFNDLSKAIVLDFETTGTNHHYDKIVYASLLKVNLDTEGEIVQDQMSFAINPGIPIPERATAIHGIKGEDVYLLEKFDKRAEAMLAFMGDKTLVAHNIEFDMRFLSSELAAASMEQIHNHPLCTMLALRRICGFAPTLQQSSLSLNIPDKIDPAFGGGFHSARYDAVTTAYIAHALKHTDPDEIRTAFED